MRIGTVKKTLIQGTGKPKGLVGITFALSHTAFFHGHQSARGTPQITFGLRSSAVFHSPRTGAPAITFGLTHTRSFAGTNAGFNALGANDSSVGTVPWNNPTNAQGPPSGPFANALTGLTSGIQSNWLTTTNYGFTVPTGATIVGVQVCYTIRNNPGGPVSQRDVSLWNGGAIGTVDSSMPNPTNVFTVKCLGGPTSLWGASLTPAIVNSSTFGAAMKLQNINSDMETDVEACQVTIFYTM